MAEEKRGRGEWDDNRRRLDPWKEILDVVAARMRGRMTKVVKGKSGRGGITKNAT